jgi:hypothetical protein
MKCLACDAILTDYEATLKDVETGEYVNECIECIKDSSANYALQERLDLKTLSDLGIDLLDSEWD